MPSTDGVAPGNLNIPAANLNVTGGIIDADGGAESPTGAVPTALTVGPNVNDATESQFMEFRDGNSNRVLLQSSDQSLSINNSNLRLATGQSIEDGSGTERLSVEGGFTSLKDENGNNAFSADDGVEVRLEARSGTPIQVRDAEGGFDALTYSTSGSAPGTFELTNAVLELPNPTQNQLQLSYDSSGSFSAVTHDIVAQDINTTDNMRFRFNGGVGEIQAQDEAGNFTTLT